ncbi:MAG: ankyrin repeat domain-containing protein [Verrucomicrobia bacterium]|nr:ankyrin repeat domain-containing protein [Verrucomicrobiota bacterium]
MSSDLNVGNKTAIFLTSQVDRNKAFISTENGLEKRVRVLEEDGLTVDRLTAFKTFEDVAQFLVKTYPDGVHMMTWRGHGGDDHFVLSEEPAGIASKPTNSHSHESVKKICQAIEKGGLLATESCSNGAGKDNLLKHLAGLCRSDVVVIGSKINEFDIQFQPGVPHFYRCFSLNGTDETRIYYKTESQRVQNVSPEQLDALWGFLGNSPESYVLSYRLIGQRNDQESYAKTVEENKPLLKQHFSDIQTVKERLASTPANSAVVSPFWQGALEELDLCSGIESLRHLGISSAERSADLIINGNEMTWDAGNKSERETAYLFLLGIALLDKHKALFHLLAQPQLKMDVCDISECIYALSSLAIHPKDGIAIDDKLVLAIKTVKNSYHLAKANGVLEKWSDVLVKQAGGCVDAVVSGLQRFYEEQILREFPSIELFEPIAMEAEATEGDVNIVVLDPDVPMEDWLQERYAHDGLERFNDFKSKLRSYANHSLKVPMLRDYINKLISNDHSTTFSDQILFINEIACLDASELFEVAIRANFFEILPQLFSSKVIDAPNQVGQRPLNLAVEHGHIESVDMLLWLGADPNLQDSSRGTALHQAVSRSAYPIIDVLVKAGADPYLKNGNGYTAYDIAQLYDDFDAAEALSGNFNEGSMESDEESSGSSEDADLHDGS